MSWSVNKRGSKDEVIAYANTGFDAAAAQYKGTEEETDVILAKERALSLIATAKPDEARPIVSLSAYGSRSVGWGGSIHVEVSLAEK